MLARSDFAVLALLALLAAGTAVLQNRPSPMAVHDVIIRATINQQIAAIRAEDSGTAFAYATPEIRRQFSSPDAFLVMVKTHYRPVYFAQTVDFTARAKPVSGHSDMRVQRVHLVDDRGAGHQARYIMQKQPDGSWRIAGCQLLQSHQIDI